MAAPQFVTAWPASGSGNFGTTSHTVTVAPDAGDILIAVVSHLGTAEPSTPPSGFTLAASQTDGATGWAGLYWRRATGSETSVAVSGGTNSTTLGVASYRGCVASGDPIDAIASRLNSSSGTTGCDAITTTSPDTRVVGAVGTFDNRAYSSWATTTPGTLTEDLELLNTSGSDSGVGIASAAMSSTGGTGALTWNQTWSMNVGFLLALLPAAGGTANATAATATGAAFNALATFTGVGADGPAYRDSSGAVGTNVTSLIVSVPAAAVAGDLAILVASIAPGDIATPSGWDLHPSFPTPVTTSAGRMYLWTRTLISGDLSGSVTLTLGASSRVAGAMLVSEPALIDTLAVDAPGTAGSVVTAPEVDPVSSRPTLLTIHGTLSNTAAEQPSWTPAPGMFSRQNLTTTAGTRNATLLLSTQVLADGSPTGTCTATASVNVQRQAVTIALRGTGAETNVDAAVAEATGQALFEVGLDESLDLVAINAINGTAGPQSPVVTVPVVADEFPSSPLSALWTVVDPAGDSTVSVVSDHLRIDVPATAHQQTQANRDAVKVLQPVGGDFDVAVKIDDIPGQVGEGWGLYADGGAGTGWLRAHVSVGADGLLHAVTATADADDGPVLTRSDLTLPDLSFNTTLYVRLARTGDQVTYWTSATGVVWTQRATWTSSIHLSRVGPIVVKDATTAASQVDVDYVRPTAAVGISAEAYPEIASAAGEALPPGSVDIVRFTSAYALDPSMAIAVTPQTAEAVGDAAATAGVGPGSGGSTAEATAAAVDAIADRSDRADVYDTPAGAASALDPGPTVRVSAGVA
ncbi:MAG: hypothetical protein ACRCZP_18870 [Phycicoccus sp.]